MNKFEKAKFVIGLILKNLPLLYLRKIYDNMNSKKLTNFTGTDEDIIKYINKLFFSETKLNLETNSNKKIDIENLDEFKKMLLDNMDNICYKSNIGSYESKLEKEISLHKKDLFLKNYEVKLLFECYKDLYQKNKIDSKSLDKINKSYLHTKYKGNGDFKNPLNYRFLFDHSKIFKILDRFITLDILKNLELTNTFPNREIYINTLDKSFKTSIKDESFNIIKENKNIILLDIKKAFPSIDWYFINVKLKKIFIKKFGFEIGKNIFQRYMFLITNRKFYYNKKNVNILKGLPTGLSSSTLIFTLIFEDIFNELSDILEENKIFLDKDYELKIFVDDIAIKILNLEKTKIIYLYLSKILNYYGYKINDSKSKVSPNLRIKIDLPVIKSGDFYLGLPFSDSIKQYLDICLKQFQDRHINIDYQDIKKVFMFKGIEYQDEICGKIKGFFQYKLFGLKKYNLDVDSEQNILINLINKFYKKID